MMGPMSGEMSIAPMMTAVLLVFKPSEAVKIASTRIHSLAPWKPTPSAMPAMVSSSAALSCPMLMSLRKRVLNVSLLSFIILCQVCLSAQR